MGMRTPLFFASGFPPFSLMPSPSSLPPRTLVNMPMSPHGQLSLSQFPPFLAPIVIALSQTLTEMLP